MPDYQDVLGDAPQLSVADRLRLIDDLASSVPDDQPSHLSPEWITEIQRRSDAIDDGSVRTESWSLFARDCFPSTACRTRVELHPETFAELDSSADWYAERSPAASRNFLVAVDVAVVNIKSDPDRFPFIDDRHQSDDRYRMIRWGCDRMEGNA